MRTSIRFLYLGLALGMAMALLAAVTAGLGKARDAARTPLNTFMVTNVNDSGPGSLRQALLDANASPGSDAIHITATGTLDLLSAMPVITDAVSLQGSGAGMFVVDGQELYRIFDIAAVSVTISDLTLQRGSVSGPSSLGAGIRSTGNLTLNRIDVLSNTAESHGGGLFVTGNLTITEGILQGNTSVNGIGGGLRSFGSTIFTGTQFIDNASRGDGGGAFVLGSLTVTNGIFQENRCTAASCDGGGLFSFSQTSIHNTHFISNTAQDQGGAAAAPGVLAIDGGVFEHNQTVFGTGGALLAQNLVTIQKTQFLSNTARSYGGGIYVFGTAVLTDVLLQDNQSIIGTGGGLFINGSVGLERVQLIHNAAREGGGMYHTQGDGYLVNSLFSENIATELPGMAMLLASTGSVEILHLTVAGSIDFAGSAIEIITGSVGITNTIITSHTVGISATGGTAHQDYNLFFGNTVDTQGSVSGGANSLNGNPVFADPAGGDYHIESGSDAIDAGADGGVTTDIDGDARPQGTGFDIGFDEAIQAPGTPTPTPSLTPTPSPTSTPGSSPTPTSSATQLPPPQGTSTPFPEPGASISFLPLITR